MKTGIEEEAKKLGVTVDVFAANSEEDTEGQLRILENCVAKGYKAIGVAPLSPTNLINGIVAANQKGIYVMNIDEKVDMDTLKNAGGSVIAFATTDNVKVGEKGANYIISKLTSGGDVAIIEGKAGNASGEARKQGATDAFKAATGINLVGSQPADWDRQKALDTAASMIQQNPNLKFLIVGDGPARLDLEEQAERLGVAQYVIFTGMVDPSEVQYYYQLGDVFVSASTSETQGLTYIEAAANGLPLLCRQDDCLADVLQEGQNGYEYTSAEEFLQAIDAMCHNPKWRDAAAKRSEQIASAFDKKAFGEAIENVYESVL